MGWLPYFRIMIPLAIFWICLGLVLRWAGCPIYQ